MQLFHHVMLVPPLDSKQSKSEGSDTLLVVYTVLFIAINTSKVCYKKQTN